MTNEKKRAQLYERENEIEKSERPLFHVTPPVGWMNDPNGFSFYDGKIHLFYQYYPYGTEWGPMHWGHQVTEDMIKWRQLPVALAPDTKYDSEGCFSGTAFEHDGRHMLIYTSVMNNPEGLGVLQNQSIAYGDGVEYTKIDNNPVVTGDMLPDNLSRADFRDPKVWFSDGNYYMLAGTVDENKKGQVVLFISNDMHNWRFNSILAGNTGELGGVWECPDFFELCGRHVLVVSPIEMQAECDEFHNGSNSIYFLGEFDKKTGGFLGDRPISLDYGTDFYAPQTTILPDGRRILIAWMQSWHTLWIPEGQKWQGMMTIPREITIKNNRLIQNPVREISKYYRNTVVLENEEISGQRTFNGVDGRRTDITVVIKGNKYREFVIKLAADDKYNTKFVYNAEKNEIEMDRTFSGFHRDVVCYRRVKVRESRDGYIKLRFILDRNSVELFINDGVMTMSTVIYTSPDIGGIVFYCDGTAYVDIEKHDIDISQE